MTQITDNVNDCELSNPVACHPTTPYTDRQTDKQTHTHTIQCIIYHIDTHTHTHTHNHTDIVVSGK